MFLRRIARRIPALMLVIASAVAAFAEGPGAGSGSAAAKLAAERPITERRATLAFEPNAGQDASGAKFIARSGGYVARLSQGKVSLAFGGPNGTGSATAAGVGIPPTDAELSLSFRGANSQVTLGGEERLLGRADYFPTGDPASWKTNLPTYGRVQYHGIYPGIDLSFYGREGRLEYDVNVAAGADPRLVQLALGGEREAHLNAQGDLVLKADAREVRFLKPVAYQLGAGGKRELVEAAYRVTRSTHGKAETVAFAVGKYDHARALVIDPVLVYGEFLPESNPGAPEEIHAIATDAAGNVYVTGYWYAAGQNAFIQKLDPNGNVLFNAQFGSQSYVFPNAIAVDAAGNISVAGYAGYGYLPGTSNAYQQAGPYNGNTAFVATLKADGSALIYASYLGGTLAPSQANGIAVDAQGKVYVTGYSNASDFPTTSGAYAAAGSDNYNFGFVAKFDPTQSGTASLVYSTALPVAGVQTYDNAIAVDSSGDAYVTGTVQGGGFATTPGAYTYNGTQAGGGGVFVTKVNPAGTALIYNANLGPGASGGIAVDGSGAVYVTGNVSYNDYPTTAGAWQTAYPAAFATKLSADGTTLVYSTFLNGPSGYNGAGTTPDSIVIPPGCASNCVATIAGLTTSADLPLVNPIQNFNNTTGSGFVIQLAANGTSAGFSSYLSGVTGTFNSAPYGFNPMAVVDGGGNIYFAGNTSQSDLPLTVAIPQNAGYGYLAKIGPANASSLQFTPNSYAFGSQVVGVSAAQSGALPTVVLRNVGSLPAQLQLPITSNDAEFTETDNCPSTLPAGGACTLTLNYTPAVSGYPSATLTVNGNAGATSAQLQLSGTGVDGGYLVSSPGSLSFGNQATGTKSAAQTFTLSNVGNQSLNVQAPYIQPSSNADATTFPEVNDCPSVLNPKQSCQVSIQFAPTAPGLSSAYVYTIANGQNLNLPLAGTGVAPGTGGLGSLSLTSSVINFGTQLVGTTGSATNYVTNTGSVPVTVLGVSVTLTSAQGSASDFSAQSYGYYNNSCDSLPPGNGNAPGGYPYYCGIAVAFTPSVAGTETATITVTDTTSTSPHTFTVTGVGVAAAQTLESNPGNAVFAPQPVGYSSAVQTFNFYNTGSAPMTISRVLTTGDFQTNGAGYGYYSPYCAGDTLNPQSNYASYYPYQQNAVCQVQVYFTPTATGVRTGTLTLIDSATGSPQTFSLVGTGVAATGSIVATPDSLVFATQPTGTTSAGQDITITNPGNEPVTINSMTASGDFAFNGTQYWYTCGGETLPFVLNAGQSCSSSAGVVFTPTLTSGTETGTLVIGSTAGNTTLNLSGTAEAATQAVELYTTSFNFGSVKKGTTSGNGGEYGVYLYNAGTEPLTFNAVPKIVGTNGTLSADFAFYVPYYSNLSNQPECYYALNYLSPGYLIAPGQGCYVNVEFTPSKAALETATMTFTDSAGTQTVALSGTGVSTAPTAQADPVTANFAAQVLTTTSPSQVYVNLDNNTASGLTILSDAITAGSSDFVITPGAGNDTCSGQIAPANSYCSVLVTFQPSAPGLRTGTITFKDQNSKLYTASLTGYAYAAVDQALLDPLVLSFVPQSITATSGNGLQGGQTLTLSNNGNLPFTVGQLTGTDVTSSATGTSDFTIYNADGCSLQTVNPGSSCTVTVGFVPSTAGNKSGSLTFPVTYQDGTKTSLAATFTGTAFAEQDSAFLTPTLATFLDQVAANPGNGLQSNTLVLTNTGSQYLTVGQLTATDTILGSNTKGDFVATAIVLFGTQIQGSDGCSGQSLAPGATCSVTVYFAPGTTGAKTGSITFPVTYTDAKTASFTANLSGNGVAIANGPLLYPGSLVFGAEAVGVTDANQQQIYLYNQGNANITIGKLSGTGFGASANFYYGASSSTCTQGLVLAPTQNCYVWVQFKPTSVGALTGTLVFPLTLPGSTTAVNYTATLGGTGISASQEITASESTLTFPNTPVNTASSQWGVTFSNRGSTAYTINSTAITGTNAADFSVSNEWCSGYTLTANTSCTVYLTFAPGASGARTATLTETDTAPGSPRTVALKGTGVVSPAISFYPATLAFGSQVVGTGSSEQTIGLTNTGAASSGITSITSTVPAEFAVTSDNCSGGTLAVGSTCTITAVFSPTQTGARTASIKVVTSAAGTPVLAATGTGVTALTSTSTLVVSPTSGAEGSLFTLTASVKDSTSSPVTVGTVNFYNGTVLLSSVQIVGTTAGGGVVGTAIYKTHYLPLGANSITAKYVGPDAASTSAAATVTVTGAYLSTTVLSSTGTQGSYVLTGTVQGAGPLTPTGNLIFTDNQTSTTLGTVALDPTTLTQTFVQGTPEMVGDYAYEPVSGDLNEDGIPDLVAVLGNQNAFAVLIGNGDGTFQPAQIVPVGQSVSLLALGDLNGDGHLDVVMTTTNSTVAVFLGKGDGTFGEPSTVDAGASTYGVSIGDFDGDGKADIVVTNYAGANLSILLGNGDGTFQTASYFATGNYPSVVSQADFNGDGKLDLVVVNGEDDTIGVLLGNGNGTFQAQKTYSTGDLQYNWESIGIGDVNGDGKLDIVVNNYVDGTVSVFTGNGSGVFVPQTPVFFGAQINNVSLGDLNGDGKLDLAVGYVGGQVGVALGNGNGTFQAPNTYGSGTGRAVTTLADFNADGRLDIAFTSSNDPTSTSSVLLNTVTQTATLTGVTLPGVAADSLTAKYGGDAHFAASVSNALLLASNPPVGHTVLAVTPASGPVGTIYKMTATVTDSLGNLVPNGTVSFYDGSNLLGTVELVSTTGVANYESAAFVPGAHSLMAMFNGIASLKASTSAVVSIQVTGKNPTVTLLTAAGVEGSYQLTAAVNGFGYGTPTGSIVFTDTTTSTALGTIALNTANSVSGFVPPYDGGVYGVGGSPSIVVQGDLNNDGKVDMVVGNQSNAGVFVLLGNGDGTFVWSEALYPCTAIALSLADVNGDGKLDLINATGTSVTVYLGNGDGTFQAATPFTATINGGSSYTQSIDVGDLNGDGKVDIVVPDSDSNQVFVLLGNGDGTFGSPQPYPVGNRPVGVVVRDFNGDGKLDVATANYEDGSITILNGNGDGTLSAGQTLNGFPRAIYVFAQDLNRDGKTDLVVTQGNYGTTLSVALNQGAGTFASPVNYSTGTVTAGLAIADVTGDGLVDLVVSQGSGLIGVLPGNGDGTFQSATYYPSGSNGDAWIDVADFNGDGRNDIASLNPGQTTLTIFLGETAGLVTLPSVNLTGLGTDAVVATYSGDGSFNGSVSNTLALAAVPLTTTTTLAVTPSTGAQGTVFTLTATVADPNTKPVTGGQVAFYNGTQLLGTVTLASHVSGATLAGTATLKTTGLAAGTNSVTAKYLGDATDVASASGAQSIIVTGQYATTTSLIVAGKAGNYTLAGLIKSAAPIAPTGTVTFTDTSVSPNVTVGSATVSATSGLAFVNSSSPAISDSRAAIVVGDFNGDGKNDMAVCDGTVIGIGIGNGDGTFQAKQTTPAGNTCNGLVSGDFNGDGKLDLASLDYYGSNISVLLGNGDGTFFTGTTYPSPEYTKFGVVGDFNKDGKLDIVTSLGGGNSAQILIGNGDGSFQAPVAIGSFNNPYQLAAGDFNGDGKLDLAIPEINGGDVQILLGNGDGTFGSPVGYATGNGPTQVAVGDLNHDGKLDLVVANGNGNTYAVSVLLGNGDGTFASQQQYTTPNVPYSVAIADFSNNGYPDIVTASEQGGTHTVLLNKGDGTFPTVQNYSVSSDVNNGSYAVVTGDFNGDGRPDFAASSTALVVDVFLSQVTQSATFTGAAIVGTGTHNVVATYGGDTNFTGSTSTPQKLSAAPVTPTITLTAQPAASTTYGTALSVVVTLSGPVGAPTPTGSVSYKVDGGSAQSGSLTSGTTTLSLGSSLALGTHTIAVTYVATPLYLAATQSITLTVTKASQTITFNPVGNVSYGVGQFGISASTTSGLAITYKVVSGPATISSGNVVSITGVGTVVLEADQAGNASYNSASAQQQFTVSQAPLTFTVTSFTRNYGAANPAFTGTFSGLAYSDVLTPTYSTTATTASPNGTYPITATLAGTALQNYAVTIVPGVLTVQKTLLTLKINNAARVYGAADPAYSGVFFGLVNGDVITAAYTSTATIASPVGSYTITATLSGAALSNYTPQIANGTLTVNPAGATITVNAATRTYGAVNPTFTGTVAGALNGDVLTANYSTTATVTSGVGSYPITAALAGPAAGNYIATVVPAMLTVRTASLTVAVNSLTKVYGSVNPTLTGTITGLLNGDTVTPTYSTTATQYSSVGSYAISASVAGSALGNYSVTVTPGNLGVTPAIVTVTVNAATRLYGGANPAFTGTLVGVLNNDAVTAVYSTMATGTSPVGTYPITATLAGAGAGNYKANVVVANLTVNPAPLMVSATSVTSVYGSALPTLTYSLSGFVNGDTVASATTGVAALSTTATSKSSVAAYPIHAAIGTLASTNYYFQFTDGILTVTPALLNVTASSVKSVYGSALPAFTYGITGFVNGDSVSSATSGTASLSSAATAKSSAGTYAITPALGTLTAANYSFQFTAGTLTITQAVVTITANNGNSVYGATLPTLSYTLSGLVNSDTVATAFTGVPSLATTATVKSGVGPYPITASVGTLASVNYSFLFSPGTLTITPAILIVTPANASSVYGATLPALTYSLRGFVNGDTTASATKGMAAVATTGTSTSATGTYPITATAGTLTAANYSLQFATGTLTISKAFLTITANSLSTAYGAGVPALTYAVTGFVGQDTAQTAFTGAPALTTTATAKSVVGNYAITVSVGTLVSSNYGFHFVNGTLAVGQTILTVTANNLSSVYGTATPTLTYTVTGFVNGDTQSSVIKGLPSLTTTATQQSPVGPYVITAAAGTLTASNNYSVQFVAGTLTITPAVLTVTAGNTTSVYGAAVPSLTYVLSGFVNGDTAATATSGAPGLSTTATAQSPVGSYPITATTGTLVASNYTVTFVPGLLTVTRAVATVTANNAASTYGGPLPGFTYGITGLVNGDTVGTAVTGAAALNTTATAQSAAGTYAITPATGTLAAANYTFIFVGATLTVGKAPLTVSVNSVSTVYGAVLPGFTYSLSGLVNGDTSATALNGFASFTTSGGSGSPVGAYSVGIVPTSISSLNYNLQFVSGTLTITKAPLTVSANTLNGVYGSALPTLTYGFSGFVNGDTQASATTGAPTLSTTAPAAALAGSYPVTIGLGTLAAHNYSLTLANGTLIVAQAALTINVNSFSRVYTAANPVFTGTVTGLIKGDTLTVTYASAALKTSGAGLYPITATVTGTKAVNYAVTVNPGTLTVTPAVLTVTAGKATSVYGAPLPPFSDTITGFLNGDTAATAVSGEAGFTTPATPQSSVGTYAVAPTLGSLAAANYSFKFVAGTLTIGKASLTVTANNLTSVHGSVLPPLTYSFSGFVNGDTQATATTGSLAISTTATSKSNVGAYPITVAAGTLVASNYTVKYVAGVLTITKATLTATAESFNMVYGATPPALTYTLSGFVGGDTASTATTGTPKLTTTATATAGPGTYPVSISAGTLAATNYSLTFIAGTATITPAPLTITVKSASRLYAAANPAFTGTLTGIKNSDALSVVYATTGVSASSVGSYPITATVSGSKAANYTITVVPGVLSITPAVLTVTAVSATVAYNQPIPSFTYLASGFLNGDTTAVLGGSPSETTTAVQGSVPGSYPIAITAGTLTAQNYSFLFKNGTLTVTSAGTAATPVLTPGAGTYPGAQTVTITDTTPGAVMYYALHGVVPTTASTKYTGPISITASGTIKVIAVATGYAESAVATATYTIQ